MSYLRIGCGLDLKLMQRSFSVLVWAFPSGCYGNWQLSWSWWVYHVANVLQRAYNETQGPLEVGSSAILGLLGSDQFLFLIFSSLQLPPEAYLRAIGFHSREG